ncbi:MAG: helix-turn-helix domain-containing protein [Burkholderiales bacterium]
MPHAESANAIQRWSTEDVGAAKRLDLYAEALTSAVDPMHVASRNDGLFRAQVDAVTLGPVSLIRAVGSTHRCVRDERDVAASGDRSVHMILNTSSAWRLRHRGLQDMRAGDIVLLDSDLGHDIELGEFAITHLKISEPWLRQWVPSPQVLAGCVVPRDAVWGQALTSFVQRLTPELVVAMPLTRHGLAEHIGMLLGLVAAESGKSAGRSLAPMTRGMVARVRDVILQRCTEPELSATDVARSLGLSTRTLHRTLAGSGNTFSGLLMAARVNVATRMLESPLMDCLTTAEIGRRAGFSDASHFARVINARAGRTPRQMRLQRE